ncbi:SDR family oxidoreductase [Alteromonas lipolytica]|uniref:SDR family oxidoreductase n=1 Tax=Alteromonas lipolytica TaxID=1856405 RepID=UPI000AEF6985|nr:SDR family oxidoreductase [Alteromonas lipolytica]GGF61976.1 short-chain dehydrogenase [Alteromonas lipolytica]
MSTVVITGANRGIGLALTKAYLARKDNVIAVCRQTSEALTQSGAEIIEGVDVSQSQGLEKLQQNLLGRKIDILINNAGIMRKNSLDNLDVAQIKDQFNVNALAPLLVVAALRDNLVEGSKIGLVTSRMGSIEDNDSGGSYGYRMSKTALNAAGKSLAIDLKDQGVAVALLHPGWVNTDMVNFNGLIEPEEAAAGIQARLDALNLENNGGFWHSNGDRLPW